MKLLWSKQCGGSEKQLFDAAKVNDLHLEVLDQAYLKKWIQKLGLEGTTLSDATLLVTQKNQRAASLSGVCRGRRGGGAGGCRGRRGGVLIPAGWANSRLPLVLHGIFEFVAQTGLERRI